MKKEIEKRGDEYCLIIDYDDNLKNVDRRTFTEKELKKQKDDMNEKVSQLQILIKNNKKEFDNIECEDTEELRRFIDMSKKVQALNQKIKIEGDLKYYEDELLKIKQDLTLIRLQAPHLFRNK